jgi:hypothetical protein
MEHPLDRGDIICDMRMTLDDWTRTGYQGARATRRIYDVDGTVVPRGTLGELCDVDHANDWVIVAFPATGAILCDANEIKPA